MRLGLDISGGDFAPNSNILGAILALEHLPEEVEFVLIGREEEIMPVLKEKGIDTPRFTIVNAPEVITMHDHPTRAIPQKPNSSISIGLHLLAKGEIDSFSSTGNTGACLVGSLYKVHAIPGIIRPCITSVLPNIDDTTSIILDVGANSDCKPDVLYQFAHLGALYSKYVMQVETPRVCLLNIGEEAEKGNLLTQSAYKLLKGSHDFNFQGNIEGRDLFLNKADVVVCDGFTGNVVLKQAEGMYSIAKRQGWDIDYFNRFNYENYGGTPILGVNADVLIGHGISNEKAVKKLLCLAYDVAKSKLTKKIKEAFK